MGFVPTTGFIPPRGAMEAGALVHPIAINFSLAIGHTTSENNKIFLSNKKSQDGLFKININTEISKENYEMIQKNYMHYSKLLSEITILDLYEFNSNVKNTRAH